MSERSTTSNGYEISHPTEQLTAEAYRGLLAGEYGIDATTPFGRIEQLQQLSNEGIAILLEHINKGVQGSESALVNEGTSFIGEHIAIRPEDRYQVFTDLVAAVRSAPPQVNPERVADTLALGIVLLHPFLDGNGRTARVIGLTFRDSFDSAEYRYAYNTVVEPRDKVRERGGFMVNGYTPYLPEGFDQSAPIEVNKYLHELLHDESPGMYTSCFGQAPLYNF